MGWDPRNKIKNNISPEEPYFATFYYYNGFKCSESNFWHLFEVVSQKKGFIYI